MKTKACKPELRALLAIRNFSSVLKMHQDQMMQLEKNLEHLNRNALSTIKAHCPPQAQEAWERTLNEIETTVSSLNQALDTAKARIEMRDRSDPSGLWQQFDLDLNKLTRTSETLKASGLSILPASEHLHWTMDICSFETTVLPLIVSHAEACKLDLLLIAKYAPEELHQMTRIILDHIPKDFTFEEADKYESDYLSAVEDIKKEFRHGKNLWDKWLDLLAGQAHQPAAERIMMTRWLEGERRDL
ncbi:MAG: hypothetical protein ACKVYV_10000 [Limisphaerales bacterium]